MKELDHWFEHCTGRMYDKGDGMLLVQMDYGTTTNFLSAGAGVYAGTCENRIVYITFDRFIDVVRKFNEA